MANATLIIDGNQWSFMGDIKIKPNTSSNELSLSRDGVLYAKSETSVPMVSVDEIKVTMDEFVAFQSFFQTCGSKRFNVTVTFDEDCPRDGFDGFKSVNFINCIITGELEFAAFEKTLSNFEFGYERMISRSGV